MDPKSAWNCLIIDAYSAEGGTGDRYVYFHHFEDAYALLLEELFEEGEGGFTDLIKTPTVEEQRKLAEIVNEILQGQSLIGNQRLIEALRIKYPRLTTIDPDNPPERLPIPPGVRDETAAIDIALLDFQTGLFFAFDLIQKFGPDILRSRAPAGNEPFPEFPRYISFEDQNLAIAPIPIKNEYWQLTSNIERLALGTVEKAKKLFKLSLQEPVAREEAKEECKKAGVQGYLGMAVLAASQSEEDFALNQGNTLLAHVKNARDLFEGINAGLNPIGNDGSFIPNESFVATFQDAQEAVADAREAEINARQEERTFDRNQADLRNELQNQRASFITPLKNLTGLDPAQYNNLKTVDDQIDYRNTIRIRVNSLISSFPNSDPTGLGELGTAALSVLDAESVIESAVNDLRNLYERIDIEAWRNTEINYTIGSISEQIGAIDLFLGIQEGMLNFTAGAANAPLALVAGIQRGILNEDKNSLQALQTITTNNTNLEAQIKGLLLEEANLGIAIKRATNQRDQQRIRLDNLLTQMDRLIEDLANARVNGIRLGMYWS